MNGRTVLDFVMCAAESVLLLFFACNVLERRDKNPAVVAVGCVVHIITIFLINPAPIAVKMPVSIALFFMLCILCFRNGVVVLAGVVAYAFHIIVMSDILFANLISLVQETDIYNTIASYEKITVVFSILVKVINFVLFLASIKYFRKINKNCKSAYSITLDIIFACFLCMSIVFASLYPILTYNPENMTLFLIMSVVFFVISFLVLSLFVKLCDYFSMEQYWTVANIKYESLKNQMDLQKEFVETSNKIRHDFKKIIGTIGYLNSQGQYDSLKSFLDELSYDAYTYKPVVYCRNEYIDAILNIKMKECEGKDIKLIVQVSPIVECNIKPDDIVLLLSNLLDNAIEAVSKISDGNRSITIKLYNYENNLIIYSENHYLQNTSKSDFFQSDKEDRNVHGYGVKIINELVNSSSGHISMEHTDGLFKATIMLPNQ